MKVPELQMHEPVRERHVHNHVLRSALRTGREIGIRTDLVEVVAHVATANCPGGAVLTAPPSYVLRVRVVDPLDPPQAIEFSDMKALIGERKRPAIFHTTTLPVILVNLKCPVLS